MGPPPCREPKPLRRNQARERANRIARKRARNRTQRPVNEAARRLDRARRREIEHREWRNHMRTMLLMFKGGRPSTSPYARWINDPFESEELPPNWQPPPDPPPPPDDPPF